ncbi:hypothetical protein GCM10028791_17210 [Echinicola sediminis]
MVKPIKILVSTLTTQNYGKKTFTTNSENDKIYPIWFFVSDATIKRGTRPQN